MVSVFGGELPGAGCEGDERRGVQCQDRCNTGRTPWDKELATRDRGPFNVWWELWEGFLPRTPGILRGTPIFSRVRHKAVKEKGFRSGPSDLKNAVPSSSSLILSSLKLSDTKVYGPQLRALRGTASHFCEVLATRRWDVDQIDPF